MTSSTQAPARTRKDARTRAERHEHELTKFVTIPREGELVDHAMCTSCGLEVIITDVGDGHFVTTGPALRLHCAPIAKPRAQPLTLADLHRITHARLLYALYETDSRGQPRRFRLSSQIKRWVRDPKRFRFSIKFGLYQTISIETEQQLAQLTLDNPSDYKFPNDL
jgi:hypothetical protein